MKDHALLDFIVEQANTHGMIGWTLFPADDAQLRLVAEHAELLQRHFTLTTPPWDVVRHFHDKRLTHKLAASAGVPTPGTVVPGDVEQLDALDLPFPMVLKPADTTPYLKATIQKARLIHSREELQREFEAATRVIDPAEIILQEWIPDPGKNLFSFAGYFENGAPLVGLAVKRHRQTPIDFGIISTCVEVVELPELGRFAHQLMAATEYTGLAELEFMWNERQSRFELLEVNARLWGWNGLATGAGLDLPYIAHARALGEQPEWSEARIGVRWLRMTDDTIIAIQAIREGRLTLRDYFSTLRGKRVYSLAAAKDAWPAIHEAYTQSVLRPLRRSRRSAKEVGRRA